MEKSKSRLKLLVKVLCSIGFFTVLFSFINTEELVEVLTRIHWGFFLLSFALTPVMLVTSCMKWKLLLDKGGVSVALPSLLKIYLIGYFFSNILPSTVGGDVVRSFYAGKLVRNQAYTAVSVFLERFTGILLLCLLVMIMPLFQVELYSNPFIYLPALGGGMVLVLCVFLSMQKNAAAFLKNRAKNVGSAVKACVGMLLPGKKEVIARRMGSFGEKIYQKVLKVKAGMQTAVKELAENRLFLLQIIALTVCFYLLTMVNVYVSFRAFGVHPEFISVCVLVPTALFVAHVPVTLLGNLGYFESIFVGYFLLVGISGAESLAMGLLLRLKMLSLGMIGLFVYLLYKRCARGSADEIDILSGDVIEKQIPDVIDS